ncbi:MULTISPECIES: hypothetical protein [unclassified Mesorhizobium]|nr:MULTISPECIES: hypothetical protein [unclassified Mesorhizobium]
MSVPFYGRVGVVTSRTPKRPESSSHRALKCAGFADITLLRENI